MIFAFGAIISEMLLRPGGWLIEWRGNNSGVIDYMFESLREIIVVKISNTAWTVTFERDVIITAEVIKLDGCN